MFETEDAGVAGNPTDTQGDIAPAVIEKFDEVFSSGDAEAAETETQEAQTEQTPAVPAQEVARRAGVRKEQRDELIEEGLEDEDGANPSSEAPGEEPSEELTTEGQAAETAQPEGVDPNLRFAAQQFGMSDAEIDALHKANPALATKTFENLLSAFQNLSRQNGITVPANQPAPAAPTAQQQAPAASALDSLFSADALKAFAETNGEEIVDKFLKPFAEERKAMKAELQQLQAYVAVQQRNAVAAEVNSVMSELSTTFPDVYGKGNTTNLIQDQARKNLYTVADQLRAGAFNQGKEMSVADALKRAHLIVTADRQREQGAKQVKEQVQRRSKQITARPTQRRSPVAPGVAKGEMTAAEAYSRRAHELGIEVD